MKNLISIYFTFFISVLSFAWITPTMNTPANGATSWTGASLDWNAVAGSQQYEVQLDTSLSFSSPAFRFKVENYINSSSSNTDTGEFFEDLYFGKTYYWRVRAWVTGDTSAWSTVRTFTTLDIVNLNSPANGASSTTGVVFDWLAHAGVDFYQLQVDTQSGFNSPFLMNYQTTYINSSSANNDTQYYVTDLPFNATVYWRVRAINAVDTSAWSTILSVNTINSVGLNSPADGTIQWTGLMLDWAASMGVDSYQMELDTSLSFSSTALQSVQKTYINSSSGNTDTEHYVTDLYFGTTYYWRVRALNAVDTSAWTMRSFTTRDYVNLDTPADGSLNWAGVNLDWLSHPGVDFYQLEVDTTASFSSTALQTVQKAYINSSSLNLDTENFTDDLFFGATYFWRVRAINAVDTSSWTMRSFNTQDLVNLTTPADGAQVWGGVTLDWYSHAGVDLYELELDTSWNYNSPALRTVSRTYINSSSLNNDTEAFIDDLLFGTEYHWRVRAINAVDTTAWSVPRSFNTNDYVNLTSPTDGQAVWTGVTFDWYSHWGVDNYYFETDTLASFDTPAKRTAQTNYVNSSSSNTDTQVTISDLYFGKEYKWRVRASNAIDTTGWSEVRTIYTNDFVNLNYPTDQAVNMSTTSLILNWNSHNLVDFYEVQWDTTNLFNSPLLQSNLETYINSSSSNPDTDHPVGALLSNQVYYWRVRAINAVDTSAWTVRVFSTGTFIPNPGVPTLIYPSDFASFVPTNPTFTWSASGTIQGYELQYDLDPNLVGATSVNTSATSYAASGLLTDTTYFWRVRSYYGGSYSDWSVKRRFSTDVYVCVPSANSFGVTACTSYTSPSGGYTWTTSGSYQDTLVNAGGCDSVLTIQVNILPALSSTWNVSACSSYYWATTSTTYTQSGTYTSYLTASTGCDSTVTLNLSIASPVSSVQNVSTCGTYYWNTNGQSYANSGSYTAVLTAANGCDSVITLNLTVLNPTSGTQQVTACSSYTWPANGITYTTSGSYSVTLTGVNGCDSVATLNLTIGAPSASTSNVSSCGAYYWPANGATYTVSGSYSLTLTNASGCDSTATLNLTINQPTSGAEQVTACSSYTWLANGVTYTNSGTYTANLTAVNGCDSVATLYLNLENGFYNSENVTSCAAYIWPVNGMIYLVSGAYTANFIGVNGCDSVYVLNLQVNNVDIAVNQFDNLLTAVEDNADYQWVDCDNNFAPIPGATFQSYVALNGGSYAVIITANGCSDTSACYLVDFSGLNELPSSQLQLSPNPADENVRILGLPAGERSTIYLRDVNGKVIRQLETDAVEIQLELTALPAGCYLVEVINTTRQVERLIKH